jgi:hypothetical protein
MQLLLLVGSLVAAQCNSACSADPLDCNDMHAYRGAGGCAASCTDSDILTLLSQLEAADPERYGSYAPCFDTTGANACHKCWNMESAPANCDDLYKMMEPGGCASSCSNDDIKKIYGIADTNLVDCPPYVADSLAAPAGLLVVLAWLQ